MQITQINTAQKILKPHHSKLLLKIVNYNNNSNNKSKTNITIITTTNNFKNKISRKKLLIVTITTPLSDTPNSQKKKLHKFMHKGILILLKKYL